MSYSVVVSDERRSSLYREVYDESRLSRIRCMTPKYNTQYGGLSDIMLPSSKYVVVCVDKSYKIIHVLYQLFLLRASDVSFIFYFIILIVIYEVASMVSITTMCFLRFFANCMHERYKFSLHLNYATTLPREI